MHPIRTNANTNANNAKQQTMCIKKPQIHLWSGALLRPGETDQQHCTLCGKPLSLTIPGFIHLHLLYLCVSQITFACSPSYRCLMNLSVTMVNST